MSEKLSKRACYHLTLNAPNRFSHQLSVVSVHTNARAVLELLAIFLLGPESGDCIDV